MSATITQNWLEAFKTNLACGHFPSKSSNPEMEGLTGMVGVLIERVLCECPDALDAMVSSPNIGENSNSLLQWYNLIKCGQLFESSAQAWFVYAMAMNKWLECCEAAETEETAEAAALLRTVTNPASDTYTAVAEDFDNPLRDNTITISDADPVTFVLPLDATIPLPVGTRIKVIQLGAGAVTADAEGAATIQGTFVTTGANDVLFIEKIATDVWHSALLTA
jgi:hypothetical protein